MAVIHQMSLQPTPREVVRTGAPGHRAAGKPAGKVEEKTIRSTEPQPPTLPDTSQSKFGLRDYSIGEKQGKLRLGKGEDTCFYTFVWPHVVNSMVSYILTIQMV